jgi:hypothetical protein
VVEYFLSYVVLTNMLGVNIQSQAELYCRFELGSRIGWVAHHPAPRDRKAQADQRVVAESMWPCGWIRTCGESLDPNPPNDSLPLGECCLLRGGFPSIVPVPRVVSSKVRSDPHGLVSYDLLRFRWQDPLKTDIVFVSDSSHSRLTQFEQGASI